MGLGYQMILTQSKDGIYRSGEAVFGILRCNLNNPRKFKSITVSLKGKGKCSWTESCALTETVSNQSATFFGKEKYVSLHQNVLPKNENTLLPGIHDLPFLFQLPPDIPSSYKDKICQINYYVVAVVSKVGIFTCTKKVKIEIQVRGIVKPCSHQPLIFRLTKSPFTIRKPVDLRIEIAKTFLAPGEKINLKCYVKNTTIVPVTALQLKLITLLTYTSNNKRTLRQWKVIEESVGESGQIKGNSISELCCTVPTFKYLYSIQNAKILMREYKLNVTMKFPFPHREGSVEIPLVIGQRDIPGLVYAIL